MLSRSSCLSAGRTSNASITLRCRTTPLERAAFLAEACAGDEALRREVESMLAAERPQPDS